MTEAVAELKSKIDNLSIAEREELANLLFASLDQEQTQESWRAEINRRLDEIRTGAAAGRPIEDVLREARGRFP